MKRLIDIPSGLLLLLVLLATGLAFGYAHLSDAAVLGAYALLFLPWALLLFSAGPFSAGPFSADKSSDKLLGWAPLIAAAVAVRLVFLFAEPLLSDDIFRYVWDGRVAQAGINPFLYAPDAQALEHLRDASLWPQINHPQVPTIYPPAAQMLFRLNAALGGGVVMLRALFLLVEAAALVAIWAILTHTGEAASAAFKKRAFVVYALCPLVFVETAWSGHLDVVAWMPLVAALLLFVRTRTVGMAAAAGAILGLSIAAKFLGLLAIPLLVLWRPSDPKVASLRRQIGRRVALVATCAAVVAVSYLPYIDAGPKLFTAFGNYASKWQGNDGPFRAAAAITEARLEALAPAEPTTRTERVDGELIFRFPEFNEDFERLGLTRTWQGQEVPATSFSAAQIAQSIAKGLAALAVALAMLWALLVRRDPIAGTLIVLLTLFLVAPIVHPWYVAWLVPLAALRHSPAALTFSFAVLAAYFAWMSARAGGPWEVPVWAVVVEYGLVGGMLLIDHGANRRPRNTTMPPICGPQS
ncbi:MAG: glycosyltransferase 87 family protein [Persicimonas sp.]